VSPKQTPWEEGAELVAAAVLEVTTVENQRSRSRSRLWACGGVKSVAVVTPETARPC
jgi:hypothetical protein